MSLRDAIKASNVPVYQELARRIGLERMRANVRAWVAATRKSARLWITSGWWDR